MDYVQEISAFRQEKDRYFATAPDSPIPPGERQHSFVGLAYYPPNPAFRVHADVLPLPQPEPVWLATSTGEPRRQMRYAELHFRIAEHDLSLVGYTDPDDFEPSGLFIPFRDATTGSDTYGAGRYLEAEVAATEGGARATTLDFNLAYNPYCAYSPQYSCPIPPGENTLVVAITAGERSADASH